MSKEIQFILYNLPDNSGTVQAYVENETLWLTQKAMAQLFDVGVPAINKHITNIFQEGELSPEATISKMEIVQQEPLNFASGQRGFSMNLSVKGSYLMMTA